MVEIDVDFDPKEEAWNLYAAGRQEDLTNYCDRHGIDPAELGDEVEGMYYLGKRQTSREDLITMSQDHLERIEFEKQSPARKLSDLELFLKEMAMQAKKESPVRVNLFPNSKGYVIGTGVRYSIMFKKHLGRESYEVSGVDTDRTRDLSRGDVLEIAKKDFIEPFYEGRHPELNLNVEEDSFTISEKESEA